MTSLATKTSEQTPFSARLRVETAARHSNAEHSGFMENLMGGKLNLEAYSLLLNQYYYIYEALEEVADGFRERSEALTAPFVLTGFDRLEAIRTDLAELGLAEPLPPLKATGEYTGRIRATASCPERFIAHHYLRYLGDLSGGQVVAALVSRHYGADARALTMYRFEDLAKPKIAKDSYRQELDRAPFSELQRDALIDEALIGFDLNARVFAELEQEYTAD